MRSLQQRFTATKGYGNGVPLHQRFIAMGCHCIKGLSQWGVTAPKGIVTKGYCSVGPRQPGIVAARGKLEPA